MDNFKNQLSQGAQDAYRKTLATQCQGRALTEQEAAFAAALMSIYGEGVHDFAKVAEELTKRGVAAPSTGGADWSEDSLARELAAINADLDAAYQEHGYGA